MSASRFPSLRERTQELAGALGQILSSSAFANRYMLHPDELPKVAAEIAESFLGFLDSSRPESISALGQSLERRGLSEGSLLALLPKLRQFCWRNLSAGDPKLHEEAGNLLDRWLIAVISGFGAAREEEILSDQEQLRRALSSSVEAQSRELIFKNHAIATSINGIMIAGLEGKVNYVNQSFLSLWGYDSSEEVLDRNFGEFWADGEGKDILDRVARRGGWFGEHTARKKDGATLTVSLSASVVTDQTGTPIGIMASLVDITERKRLETQMQQIQKMDDLGQLAGGIVHDFNNLLTAIGGYLQLLLLEAIPESRIYSDLMQIKAAVDRGVGLTKQLHYFTRQATGSRQLVSLNDVARETYELLKRTFPAGITIRLELSAFPWMIEADPNQMSQVLMNLCVNAREAILERAASGLQGGAAGIITIETTNASLTEEQTKSQLPLAPGRYVLLRVSDTGIGMPPELVGRLFIPFVSTKIGKGAGGLGLSVVYGIVRNHGGFLDVRSRQGIGTTFDIYLPMAQQASTARAKLQPDIALSQGEGTILVVDDEVQVREVMVRALELCGYRALEAESGEVALSLFAERPTEIGLVILDMVMPGMDGPETLAKLREIDPTVSVLLVTGYTADRIAHSPEELGAKGLIEKPLDFQRFTERISEFMRGRP